MGVLELDFKNLNWSDSLVKVIDQTDIVLAADGKYTQCSTCNPRLI